MNKEKFYKSPYIMEIELKQEQIDHPHNKQLAMKHDCKYEYPSIEIIAVAAESVLCASMVFGNEGRPGKDYFDENDINDGGDFGW